MSVRPNPFALEVAPDGTARLLSLPALDPVPVGSYRWVHFDRSANGHLDATSSLGAIDAIVADELMSAETRPRTSVFKDGLIVNLRAVNHNPGDTPEDLLALHLWLTPLLVISVSDAPVRAVEDLRLAITTGAAPRSAIEFLASLAHRITDQFSPVVTELVERLDSLEERSLAEDALKLRRELVPLRRDAITLRRYVAPQREALMRLSTEPIALIDESQRLRLREAANETTLFVEELDLVRERASLLNELFYDRRADEMNRTMVVLAVVTVIFLPLNLLVGLLGMNVHGIPWASEPWAFAGVCLVTFTLAAAGLWLFRCLRWI